MFPDAKATNIAASAGAAASAGREAISFVLDMLVTSWPKSTQVPQLPDIPSVSIVVLEAMHGLNHQQPWDSCGCGQYLRIFREKLRACFTGIPEKPHLQSTVEPVGALTVAKVPNAAMAIESDSSNVPQIVRAISHGHMLCPLPVQALWGC